MKKVFRLIFIFLLIINLSGYANAQTKQKVEPKKEETKKVKQKAEPKKSEKPKDDKKVVEPKKEEPKKEEPKKEEIEKKISNPKLNKADINSIISDNDNLTIIDSVDNENNKVIGQDKLQFITFKTKKNQVYYLVIDYTKHNKQIKMLKEVDDIDLLNLLTKEEKKIAEERKEKEESQQTEPSSQSEEPKKDEKSSSLKQLLTDNLHIIIAILLAIVYFIFDRIRKKNKEKKYTNDEEIQ